MTKFNIKSDLCTGCMNCVTVCSLTNSGSQDRSASLIRVDLELFSGKHSHIYCRQCENPECRRACPEGAINKDLQSGAWTINYDLCTKCGRCVDACPFGAMFWYACAPIKCELCGGKPACCEACRFNAITPEEDKL
ncbi:MAG: 4Fe-4S dicluster domain-containing protein [Candidatus Aegiribacteria sp.]|nr:4Fe-4S dicluster domain-containing protein [Candidatus Aegiribacteria sp.]